jgi:biotin carboxylase
MEGMTALDVASARSTPSSASPGRGPAVNTSNNRLLVTEDAPAYGVLAAVRALRGAGYRPWLAVTGRDAYSRHSRACAGVVRVPDPSEDRDGYVAGVVQAAVGLDVAAVMPGTDLGLLALAAADGAFPARMALGVAEPDTVYRATNKIELEALAARAGLRSPPSVRCIAAEIEAGLEVQLPAVVKAARTHTATPGGGFATSRVRRVETKDELLDAVRQVPGDVALVQQALDGQLAASCGVAWRGEVVAIAHQVSHRIFPSGNGITAFAESVEADPAVEAGISQLIGSLSWSGIFQAQFVSCDSDTYLIDLNPRIYGSMALAVAAGLNLPVIWADLLLGRAPRIGRYKVGARFRSEERDLAALATAILGRDWRAGRVILRPRRRTAHALGSIADPLPLLMSGRMARIRRAGARRMR